MSDMRLTNEKMKTFVNNDKIGMFQTAEKLTEFGEKQDEANEALAYNVNDLIKRVCALEEVHIAYRDALTSLENKHTALMDALCTLEDKLTKNTENMKNLSADLKGFRRELDRIRLSDKLNTSAIERLDKSIRLIDETIAGNKAD